MRISLGRLRFLFVFGILVAHASAADLILEVDHRFGRRGLQENAFKNILSSGETVSLTRLSYYLSELAFQNAKGEWVEAKDQVAWMDLARKRTRAVFTDIPEGEYRAMRFSIGVGPKLNHGDPAVHPADHALNPALSQLHWTWKDGYIFLAIEGLYHSKTTTAGGFSYHFANDWNLTKIETPIYLNLRQRHTAKIVFDVKSLFEGIVIDKDGNSTHSREGDLLAKKLKVNIVKAFSVKNIRPGGKIDSPDSIEPFDVPKKSRPYELSLSRYFPQPALPRDNPLIHERVELGKALFFDPRLSKDGSISCASCHQPAQVFSDSRRLSLGIRGQESLRHSMPLFNLAWKQNLFWDGRVKSLREQVVHPLTDPREMGETIPNVLNKLKESEHYRKRFSEAYASGDISQKSLTFALEAYLLTLMSQESKFDQSQRQEVELSELEQEGLRLFMTEFEPRAGKRGADCFHCHGGALFTDNTLHNNGLPETDDLGFGAVSGRPEDVRKFLTPSLRNIALTAPYMHDGSMQTLDEVLEHYSSGVHRSETLDANLAKHPVEGIQLSEENKQALIAFLKTLTDPQFLPVTDQKVQPSK